jgi:DNA-binding winged helix-turn-helix (wHTH) protein
MDPTFEIAASIAFGRFRVLPSRRELLADGRPLRLGGRAFDTLMALIEARGAVVSKDALIARRWPDRVVEENNLQVQIVALRRAFGEDRGLIRTVSRRGYQFTGEVRIRPLGADRVVTTETVATDERDVRPSVGRGAGRGGKMPAELAPTNLPEPMSELIGREEEVGEILNLAAAHRLVTLTGAGGIGKTKVALALARELQRDRPRTALGKAGLPSPSRASCSRILPTACGWPSSRRLPIPAWFRPRWPLPS